MQDLIERLEKATGPNLVLEQQIMWRVRNIAPEHRHPADRPLAYTASIDAAAALVPEGDPWTLGQNIHHRYWSASVNEFGPSQEVRSRGLGQHSTSAAIALCIAALKARSKTPLKAGE